MAVHSGRRPGHGRRLAGVLGVVAFVALAAGQRAAAAPAGDRAAPAVAADDNDDGDGDSPVMLDSQALDQRLQQTEQLVRNNQPLVTLGGYIDFGFFAPQGNGSGYVEDYGHSLFPA